MLIIFVIVEFGETHQGNKKKSKYKQRFNI